MISDDLTTKFLIKKFRALTLLTMELAEKNDCADPALLDTIRKNLELIIDLNTEDVS